MGNVLFSCDVYVVTPVQVDVEVMGWKKCICYVRGFEGIHLTGAMKRERRNMTFLEPVRVVCKFPLLTVIVQIL